MQLFKRKRYNPVLENRSNSVFLNNRTYGKKTEYFNKNREKHLDTDQKNYHANKDKVINISRSKEDRMKHVLWFLKNRKTSLKGKQ
jgi:hypothetical protein